MGRLFGTDGVRGVANVDLTPELAFAIGRCGAAVIARDQPLTMPIVVGRDTRVSGTMLEAAIVAGIMSTGRDVITVGVVPTPGVATITTFLGAAAGVMISASHNPVEDNGIKFFGADGFKLSDAVEDEIERRLDDPSLPRPTHTRIGRAFDGREHVERYADGLIEAGANLHGLTIVVDAAFGAGFAVGPRVLAELGAHVVPMNAEDDGTRINVRCGATHLAPLAGRVRHEALRRSSPVVGVAFDGDADRALFVDEAGATLSGDHTMLIIARDLKARAALVGDTVVGTVMSNIGLERALAGDGITLARAAVGDRYVLAALREGGFRFGGEQSGHIIDLVHNTTGDGLMTAVMLFSIVARRGVSLHMLAADLVTFPQVLVNVRVERKDVVETSERLAVAIANVKNELGDAGRVLVRASGTEPLIRVMIEGPDHASIALLADDLARLIAEESRVADGPVTSAHPRSP
jgi:phosphoglucosamine mutase